MKATMHTPTSTLIADITPVRGNNAVRNRRGHFMEARRSADGTTATEPQHYCHVHTDAPVSHRVQVMSYVRNATTYLGVIAGIIWTKLPRWSPQKFTLNEGLTTSWKSTLPSRNFLGASGVLAGMLLMAGVTVWALPLGNVPIELPPRTGSPVPISTQPASSGVLSAEKDDQILQSDTWTLPAANGAQSAQGNTTPSTSTQNTTPSAVNQPTTTTPVVTDPPVVTSPEPEVVTPPVVELETPTIPEVPTPTDPDPTLGDVLDGVINSLPL